MSIIFFIIILLVLILAHELGHFIVAKSAGIRVDEFGIGFPPRAGVLWRRGETAYTINWLPFGGFVKIFGENPDDESMHGPDRARSMSNKPAVIQALVLVAGVVFNMLLAWFLLTGVFMLGTDITLDNQAEIDHAENIKLVVNYVIPDSPAAEAGLKTGDIITSLKAGADSLTEFTPESTAAFIESHAPATMNLIINRNGTSITEAITPTQGLSTDKPDRYLIGISMDLVGFLQYTNPASALYQGGGLTIDMTKFVWSGLVTFFKGLVTFKADFSEVAGPIGIVGVVGQAAASGFTSVLFLTALISINLAIINILPIPALDGGRLLFLVIETAARRRIPPRVANTIHSAFFALLILLIFVVSYFDVLRIWH